MSNIAIAVNNVSKQYRLGKVGTGTLRHDINRLWHTVRGKEDPYLKVGAVNDRTQKASSDYVWALRDINFEVKAGEVLGIIGRNGAGKSTLLKILSKITTPTTGEIRVNGRIASLLEVGTGFHPELTGRENIYLNGSILGMRKWEIDKKFDEIVDFAGTEAYIDTPVKRYSSGMKVRLGFAVAAFLEPEILVVDEVLAVGDAEFQKKCIGRMQEVSDNDGRTVLFVSHNMAAVKSLCKTGLVIKQGTIDFAGTAEDAVNNYLKVQAAEIGSGLLENKDRKGNGKLQFENIIFKNYKDQVITDAISGEPLTIELHYSLNQPIDPRRLIAGVTLFDNMEAPAALFISDEMGLQFNNIPPKGKIVLRINSLSLRGETYSVRLMAFEGSTEMINALDFVENAAMLTVLPNDIHGAGKIGRPGHYAAIPASMNLCEQTM